MRTVALNRFYETDPKKVLPALDRIFTFTDRILKLTSIAQLQIAVNAAGDALNTVYFLNNRYSHEKAEGRFLAYPVQPWGFVPPINAALAQLRGEEYDALLILSTEMEISNTVVQHLVPHLDTETLVTGVRLPGHDFREGWQLLTGTTAPWNTCALWSLQKLRRQGFPMIGEAFAFPQTLTGVEEVGAIRLYQQVYGDCSAKLVEVPGVQWVLSGLSEERRNDHEKKMKLKCQRPHVQCAHAQLPERSRVLHIAAS